MGPEVEALIMRAATALRDAGAREVFLFGSASRRSADLSHDIDLAVSGLPPERFFFAMGRARRILRRPLDLVDLDEPNPFTAYLKSSGELRRVG